MSSNKRKSPRRFVRLAASALVLCLVAAGFWLFSGENGAAGSSVRAESREREFANYDIREDKEARMALRAFRNSARAAGLETARGVERLKRRVPALRVESSPAARGPEIIGLDPSAGKAYLARSTSGSRADTLRQFLAQNSDIVGARAEQISQLRTAADYTDPDGRLSFVELRQEINGIPVFQGEVKAGFNANGDMFRVVNNIAPGVDTASVSSDFADPSAAVAAAAQAVGAADTLSIKNLDAERSTATKVFFGEGDSSTTAEKTYFSTEPGVAVPAWRILMWQPANAYYVIVDANSGTLLWRKNLTEDQVQPAVYDVFTNPRAMINVAHNPFPLALYPTSPNGVQGARIKLRSIQRVGNEPPYEFNQLGWITDGGTKTDGNAVQAGLDRDGTDGIDTNGEALSPSREFRFAYHPADPNNNNGEAPVPSVPQTYPGTTFQQGAVTQLFYVSNWFHDETYRLGFTEAAGNFQNVNFTGQGVAGDRIRAEAQDSLSTNNANFTTAADGTRGRMQMYIFTGPNPDIDGSLDGDTVVHELAHGLSNRLHGNASGLSIDIARGMGEGWSDFFALSMLATPEDPIDGVYPASSYLAYNHVSSPSFVNNNYYGMRRFPYAVMSSVGPNGKPHDPLTFADIDQTKMDLSDGAYPRGPVGGFNADEVHNIGEVWCSALWEVRARMMQRLGNEVGNRRMLQFVIDGMKLAPLNPTPLTERDAMIAGAVAGGTAADVADIWAGFAIRGMGASASIQAFGGNSIGGTGTVRVTEAFDLPNVKQTPAITISDAGGNNNSVPDPGETIVISVPLSNTTGLPARVTSLELVGSTTQSYGTIAHGSTVTRNFTYTVPAGTSCGSVLDLSFVGSSSLGPIAFTRSMAIGSPVVTFSENFDSMAAPAVPAGWTVTSSLPAMTFVSTTDSFDTAPNSMFAADPTSTGGSTELTSPSLAVNVPAANVSFRHRYNTEPGWDGGVLEISIAGGDFQDIITAGGSFLQNGYNDFLTTSGGNPVTNRFAWTGNSGGYVTSVVRLPASTVGQNVQLRWRMGADRNTAPSGGGWNVDSIQFAGSYSCAPIAKPSIATLAGRVVTSDGRGLRSARVQIDDGSGTTRSAVTGIRGGFRFDGLVTGHTYVVTVLSRRFVYASVTVTLSDSISDLQILPAKAGAQSFPDSRGVQIVKE